MTCPLRPLGIWNFGFGISASSRAPICLTISLFACGILHAEEPTVHPPDAAAIRPLDPAAAAKVSFARDIKAILTNRCLECHGSNKPKSGFVAKSVALLLKGGKKDGPAVIPGKPDESPIVLHVRGLRKPKMPKEGPGLTEDELHLLRQWIAAGAKDDSDAAAPSVGAVSGPRSPEAAEQSGPGGPSHPAWEPDVDWSPVEKFTVRRFQRLALLPPPPPVPWDAVGAGFPSTPPGASRPRPADSGDRGVDAPPTPTPIDAFIVAKWASAPPGPAPELCDDATFVRRVYLDVIGVVPTAEEARKFVADTAPDKRAKLVDALLARNADYAAHWVPFWEDALCSNGNHQGGVGTRGNYRKWVYENFLADKPYDLMVAELIDPTLPNHPERFVLNNEHMKTLKTAADAAQVFLGTSLKCASCHSHFLNKEWPQARAAAFAGYFSTKDLELIRCEKKTGEFIETKFPFDLPGAPAAAPSDFNERLHLVAQLVTDPTNPRFAKAIVNRLWRRYFGLGLFEPADDFRLDQPPSHPELLDWLADDFLRYGCNLKHTIRLVLTSRAYQLRYDPALEDRFDVEKPAAPRYYRSPSLRRLTAEQLLDSIRAAGAQKIEGGARTYLSDDSTPLTRSLGRPATRNETSTSRPDDVAVVQALELMNGPEYHDRVYKGALVEQLAHVEDAAAAVKRAYWSALSRAPSEKEREAGAAFLRGGVGAVSGREAGGAGLVPAPDSSSSGRPQGSPLAAAPASTGSGAEAPSHPAEEIWVDDALPEGAKTQGAWAWGMAPQFPVAGGKKSHRQGEPPGGQQQHFFIDAKTPLKVEPADDLVVYVHFNPANPPKEILLQWHAGGDWNHRAYWGEDLIKFEPRHGMGALPKAGLSAEARGAKAEEWTRLTVPAAAVGFEKGGAIDGISFDQFDGVVTWDKAGVVRRTASMPPEAVGDLLWALFTSAEFQYIR